MSCRTLSVKTIRHSRRERSVHDSNRWWIAIQIETLMKNSKWVCYGSLNALWTSYYNRHICLNEWFISLLTSLFISLPLLFFPLFNRSVAHRAHSLECLRTIQTKWIFNSAATGERDTCKSVKDFVSIWWMKKETNKDNVTNTFRSLKIKYHSASSIV